MSIATATTTVVRAEVPEISSPADGNVIAVRLQPPVRRAASSKLVMVGDSITAGAPVGVLAAALQAGGWDAVIDGRGGRSILNRDTRYSGVDAVARLKAAGTDAPTWLIALGTNDLNAIRGSSDAAVHDTAQKRIRLMLDAIGPGRTVYWVDVQCFTFSSTVTIFNEVVAEMTGTGELAGFVAWGSISAPHRAEYFTDAAHLTVTGYGVWVPEIIAMAGVSGW
jgi:hypothetical protein